MIQQKSTFYDQGSILSQSICVEFVYLIKLLSRIEQTLGQSLSTEEVGDQ